MTDASGGVRVFSPAPSVLRWMQHGGRWRHERPGFVDEQIERLIGIGVPADIAKRYCRALAVGGCSSGEAFALVRDRSTACRECFAHDLVDPADLPDRWFRDAWRRSHNGGPIRLDTEACRQIQWQRVQDVAAKEAAKLRPREINLGSLRDAILSADKPEDIRRIWPHGT